MRPTSVPPWRSRPTIGMLAAGLFAVTATPALADVFTFYGIDIGSGPGSGVRPESDAAHADFIDALAPGTIGVEDFEDEAVGPIAVATPIGLEFAGTPATGGLLIQSSFTGSIEGAESFGLFGSSGTRFLSVGAAGGERYFTLTFSAPTVAFGFYGSSISNYATFGNFAPTGVRLDDGELIDVVNVPTGTIPNDSASFFGLVSDTPFTNVTLFNPAMGTTDGIGMDDITVPAPPPLAQLLTGSLGLAGVALRRRSPGSRRERPPKRPRSAP